MDSKTGISTKRAAADAVSEAVAGVSKAKGIIFFTDYDRLVEIGELLDDRFPDAEIIGTAGTAYFNTSISDRDILIVTAITGRAEISSGVICNLSSSPLSGLYDVDECIREISPGKDNTVCIEFCTNDEEKLVSTINIALEKRGIPLVGGTVFGTPDGKDSLVVQNGEAFKDACAYMLIKNTGGKAYVYRENIYERGDSVPHVATRVNLATKELVELDGKPAADIYAEETNLSRSEVAGNVLQKPLGRVVGDEVFICSMYDVGKNGSLFNYKRTYENDQINILELGDYRSINEGSADYIKDIAPNPSLVFSVNCIYRYMLFQNEGYLQDFLKLMSTTGPYVGYIGGGEQYKNQHVNQTMVCAIFE